MPVKNFKSKEELKFGIYIAIGKIYITIYFITIQNTII